MHRVNLVVAMFVKQRQIYPVYGSLGSYPHDGFPFGHLGWVTS
jgi:hypothetical protein